MTNIILFILMEVPGIHNHVISWIWCINYIHHLKSILERNIQYFKDRTEGFDHYYPCLGGNSCNLLHVHNWIKLSYPYTILLFPSNLDHTDRGEVVSKVNRA